MGLFRKSSYKHLMISAAVGALTLGANAAWAQTKPITIQPQALASALHDFGAQTGRQIMFTPEAAASKMSRGVNGATDEEVALAQLLDGTGLTFRREANIFLIQGASDPQSGSAAGDGADGTVQALIVTAQKREENIQDVPIAMSAFTQEQLERSQVAGGPDLITQVPNMTFTKTNFTSYSIQIRGIGTQAISATTDAAVAVAFNNTPFIRNRFFEQEFYDLQRVEVLRGPQGTLYGRNATAGVVNLISAKPKFTYEAKLSADVGNYSSTRLEGMLNLPLVEDKVALRFAGAWTKRDGYDTNQISGGHIDGRDLWSTRLSLRIAPTDKLDVNLIWEHFEENDDRLRSGKQLCHQDDRTDLGGHYLPPITGYSALFNQGCLASSLYSPDSYEAPNGYSLPYYLPLGLLSLPIRNGFNPYASLVQSPDLRVIESTADPHYRAKSDLAELQWKLELADGLTLASETAYGADFVFSSEDFNRFNTAHGAFDDHFIEPYSRDGVLTFGQFGGIFCDPQIGCTDRLAALDLSTARSRQFSQEFRLSSDYSGPFNFSLGANFLRYDTEDKYYVFINTLTLYATIAVPGMPTYVPGVSDNRECMQHGMRNPDPRLTQPVIGCIYIDPNPIGSLNDQGHNYFLSRNPYKLISYAGFGEAYYNIADALKLTAGLRFTVDKKEAPRIPSWVLAANSVGYPVEETVGQEWREPTGRLALDWKPQLSFTDDTLLYASYARGYKAGGTNPPPTGTVIYANPDLGQIIADETATKPKVFKPEFVNAFEVGAKNTLLDGRLVLNGNAFYYDYSAYQISQIIDRSAVNYNFDAKVWGLEFEAEWQPLRNLRLAFKSGYERTRVADGSRAIDIMDRTAGHSDWIVVRPFPTQTSNCILPLYTATVGGGDVGVGPNIYVNGNPGPCEFAYLRGLDPVTGLTYVPNPTEAWDGHPIAGMGYIGFDPTTAPNNGEGFFKQLGGNELPNAPHFTSTVTADYTLPLPNDWLVTLHGDFYYQSEAWSRIFNTPGYDRLKAYTNVNLAAIFANEEAGWRAMAYVKNIFDKDNITGAFLNSDDTGLTTNVFLNEPRLYGLRITKEWTGARWWTGGSPDHPAGQPYPLTVELGGQIQRQHADYETLASQFLSAFPGALDPTSAQHGRLDWGDGREVKVTWRPSGSTWSVIVAARYGRTNSGESRTHRELAGERACAVADSPLCDPSYEYYMPEANKYPVNWSDGTARQREAHTLVDFAVGRDVGMGNGVTFGLRYGQFRSNTDTTAAGVPDWYLPQGWLNYHATSHSYEGRLDAERSFTGAGPEISWDGSLRLLGDETVGRVDLDWSAGAGVLFGRQRTTITGSQTAGYFDNKYTTNTAIRTYTSAPDDTPPRNRSATVPLVDLSLAVSFKIDRLKLSTGYRWERYFEVFDGGYAEHKSYDRTIDGPYFKIAVGFGG